MEMVIPPRDHGPSTYRYTWDENGEVTQVTRVRDEHASSAESLARGRQTVQWPFQSIISEADIPSPTSPYQQRRATTQSAWQPQRSRDGDNAEGDSVERDIVPDYVVNFLRGETPESIAIRKQSRVFSGSKRTEPQHVDLVAHHQYQNHQSRIADFEGFHFRDDSLSLLGRPDSREGNEEQQFLSGEKADRGSVWRGLTAGWRAGIALNVLLMFLVLVAGFSCLIVAISRSSLSEGKSAIIAGSCDTVTSINLSFHAAISILVMTSVAGGNYVFQILSSPTRDEVTTAHHKRKWLDIGIPSFRNLGRIETSRMLLALVVLASAALTQIMYNAVIFVSQTAPTFKAAVVSESFVRGAPFSNGISNSNGAMTRDDLLTLQQQAVRGQLVRFPAPACIDPPGGPFQTHYSALLIISNLISGAPPLIQTAGEANFLPSNGAGTTVAGLTIDPSSIEFCLVRPGPAPTCEISMNASLLGVVALLNSISLVATAAVLFRRPSSFQPLATLGDAISSFLEEPDPTTQGACLLSKTDVWQGRWVPRPEAKYWVPKDHYWLRTVSFPRWLATASIWAACAGLAGAGLAISVTNTPDGGLSAFGVAYPYALISLLPAGSGLSMPAAAVALIACLPQALLAILYFAVNALVTAYFLSHESSLFAKGPRPLRVSSAGAQGAQTTSFYLTLPRAVSWGLMGLFAAMAFVLSQSFFVVAVQMVDFDMPILGHDLVLPSPSDASMEMGAKPMVALGLSGIGLLTLLVILVVLAVAVLGLGLRRAPPAAEVNGELVGNPMALPAGSCSAVISARCHPLARERGLQKKPVMWGVVRDGYGLGASHCGFTAGRAGMVCAGRSYA